MPLNPWSLSIVTCNKIKNLAPKCITTTITTLNNNNFTYQQIK
jgi:hypothetical protein